MTTKKPMGSIVDVRDDETEAEAKERSGRGLAGTSLHGMTAHQIVQHGKATANENAEALRKKLASMSRPAYVPPPVTNLSGEPSGFTPARAAELRQIAEENPVEAVEPEAPMPRSGVLKSVAIDDLVEGKNVRKVIGDLTELSASIAKVGVLQAPVVRGLGGTLGSKYEIVFGHRRIRAAKLAGLSEVLVDVRQLTDAQVVEAQLVENLQRVGLDPLDEAEGFERLQKEYGYTTAVIAAKVGKSVRWVQTRLQLTNLCPEARKALASGAMVVEVAVRVASIASHKLQAEATEKVTAATGLDKERMSARAAKDYLAENYTTELRGAPFPTKDAFLVPEAGACTNCPKRTGANPDLFGDLFSRADVCTDIICFKEKREAAWELQQQRAKNSGKSVVGLNEGHRIFKNGNPSHDSKWVDLDAVCPEDTKKRTWREVLGDDALAPESEGELGLVTVAPDTSGKAHELVEKDEALRIAKEAGLKWASRAAELEEVRKPGSKEEQAKKEREEAVQFMAEAVAIGEAVKWVEKNGVSPAVLRMMGFGLAAVHRPDVLERRQLGTDRDLVGLIEKTDKSATLLGLVFEMAVSEWVRGFGGFSDEMKVMAKTMKIDLKEIEKAQRSSIDAEALFESKKSKTKR